ncbi:hypothetical protein BSLG_005305 [Batrachochytrium salamandrivorans]|nr:hypothetical protein BSLG_005305 [Batrachochytrium salamandrivorans]
MSALFWRAGGLLGATGVICGAFGSHGLKRSKLSCYPLSSFLDASLTENAGKEPEAQRLTDSWQTASHYQIGHAIVLLATSARMHQVPYSQLSSWLAVDCWDNWLFVLNLLSGFGS